MSEAVSARDIFRADSTMNIHEPVYTFRFSAERPQSRDISAELLGGKGANLAHMCALGLPVPPGFTVTTDVCTHYFSQNRNYPSGLQEEVSSAIQWLETMLGRSFSGSGDPLLLAVRSGARVSMPGMMDTVLNLGLNDATVKELALSSGDERFAYDTYRRLIEMYADVVMGIRRTALDDLLDKYKHEKNYTKDTDMSAEDWQAIIGTYKAHILSELGKEFPQDPATQLWGALNAVFDSWMTPRAISYREIYDIPGKWGTAATVQAMVFGNRGPNSATGVTFSRNPSTGQRQLYGEFLANAQGEDVVAGIRTPNCLTKAARESAGSKQLSLEETMPDAFHQLHRLCNQLEAHFCDMQDIEFTIDDGTLYLLQTRAGKRTAEAAVKIAVDMVDEGLISKRDALLCIDPQKLGQLLHSTIDPSVPRDVITRGLPASPGAASGEIVFDANTAQAAAEAGRKVILVRNDTSPEDIHGMHAAQGILTARGGMTSHASVVARGMGKPCVSGAGELRIDADQQKIICGAREFGPHDIITIDGATGDVLDGRAPTTPPQLSEAFMQLMQWADEAKRMHIRANAETPADVKTALDHGASGIGLCRTEHMFFDETRIFAMREMILSGNREERRQALDKLLSMQQDDFLDIFKELEGRPITIRLFDPPLHEFLPKTDPEIGALSKHFKIPYNGLHDRIAALREMNPMLGHRGCRLAINFPEIVEMQARAIFLSAHRYQQEFGGKVDLEIMVPLVATLAEFEKVTEVVAQVHQQIEVETGISIDYKAGTMIELPSAALRAAQIAKSADFFSFGTNDLTQTVLGISRDDSASFMETYVKQGIFEKDPFVSVDIEAVGEIMKLCMERTRASGAEIKAGICGEHGGDPDSIQFFETLGLDYVSCSPYRVPIARLACAQAALAQAKGNTVSAMPEKQTAMAR